MAIFSDGRPGRKTKSVARRVPPVAVSPENAEAFLDDDGLRLLASMIAAKNIPDLGEIVPDVEIVPAGQRKRTLRTLRKL